MSNTAPVISIVGRSGAGKTHLLVRLIPQMKKRGLRVAVVKHSACDFQLDHEGKDTWRHAQAGADVVAISSPTGWGIISRSKQELPLEDICRLIGEVDIIFTEGYLKGDAPKVEVLDESGGLLSAGRDLIAVVGRNDPGAGVPWFDPGEVALLADLLEERFIRLADSGKAQIKGVC